MSMTKLGATGRRVGVGSAFSASGARLMAAPLRATWLPSGNVASMKRQALPLAWML